MEALEDRLQHFSQSAAEAIDGLMALMPARPAAQDAGAAESMLRRYGELVQRIQLLAWDHGLAGLQSVCALVETNLLLLQGEARTLSDDECALLEGWPMLLLGYLASKGDLESSTALLQNLSATWPMTLPLAATSEELRLLTGQAAPAPAEVPAERVLPDALQSKDALLPGEAFPPGDVAPPRPEAQQVEPEMIAILAGELAQMEDQFGADLTVSGHGSAAQLVQAMEGYSDFLERLRVTVDSVGLCALADLLARLRREVGALSGGLSGEQQGLLRQLAALLAAYLAAPGDGGPASRLVALLADAAWPSPLPPGAIPAWESALANVRLAESAVQVSLRPAQAHWEDVSLELPDDVNNELLDGLFQELPVQVAAFAAAIGHISLGKGSVKDLERAMRAAHTLKGAANTVGVRGIATLTHHLEDIIVALLNAQQLPSRALSDVLVNASDCLEGMSEFLLGLGTPPGQAVEVLQAVLDCANRIDRDGLAAGATEIAPEAAPAAPGLGSGTEAELPVQEPAAPQPVAEQSLRVPAPVVDELLRLAGETLISNAQIQEHLRMTLKQTESMRRQHKLLQQLVAELEEMVDIRSVTSPERTAERRSSEFDALEFEEYSELHTVTRRLAEATTDAQEISDSAETQLNTLRELLEDQHRLQMANQHAVLRTRMVAVSSIVPRLQRGVRQTGRLLDKSVEFLVRGENTTIDSHLLADLMDPLMHILRNAVDHGIEVPEKRVAAGKPAHGRIELSFVREGNSIVVTCADDGGGLDYAAIRRIAESKGMLKPEATEDELARLILMPGFSTREEASQVSGRGVGMDVVYSRVQEMKGMLALNSRQGQGLTIELRLPATLLSAHTLIIRQREKRLAVSTRGVEDIRYVPCEQIMEVGSRLFFRDGENMFGLLKLEQLLSMPHDRRARDRQGFPVLMTRGEDGKMRAILVQEIMESREVVMKNFGRYVPRTVGVVGAVILGDGSVAPVIDLVELLHTSVLRTLSVQRGAAPGSAGSRPEQKALRALVVDDSLSARRAVVQVLSDAGFEVRTASDGLDAVNILEKYVPDIILSDMEMPRMNGLELTSNVRHTETTKRVPIIMITSRSTEKHRKMSKAAGVNAHIVKPFSDDALLEQVRILVGQK